MSPPPERGQRPNPDLSDEVEAFLRSVQQKQKQGQRRAQPPRRPRGPAQPPPVTAQVVEAQIVGPPNRADLGRRAIASSESVAQEAEQLGKQAQSLGAVIDRTDERVAEQIHAKFDHQLGQFDADQAASDDATQAGQPDTTGTDVAADLRRMLSDPRDIRRAIVLSEILNPPVDRW